MAAFEDFTEYSYLSDSARPDTKNIGWLGEESSFKIAIQPDNVLDLVWSACSISIAQTRGFHLCPFCGKFSANCADRGSESLFLGTTEISVLSKNGRIYAAPTLMYHYMAVHHYCPPDEFLTALVEGPMPPDEEYFAALRALDLTWRKTSIPSRVRYRFVKLPDMTIVKVRIDDDE